MSFSLIHVVLLAVVFLIPGFLFKRISLLSVPYEGRKKTELLEYLALSCLTYLFSSPGLFVLIPRAFCEQGQFVVQGVIDNLFWWLSIIFLLPAFLGLIAGVVSSRCRGDGWPARLLRKFGFSVLHPAPTAWDYCFARTEGYWARIGLKNGRMIEGIYSSSSLASSVPGERDLFLESVFEWDADTESYNPVEFNQGMWINASAIEHITFIREQWL